MVLKDRKYDATGGSMLPGKKTFRIFISSTFNDLKAERNALQEHVYPQLRELAADHGYHLQVIDLRWGVSEQASLDQQAIHICLNEIERCQLTTPRPNFIILLGDRYGWCPPPSYIPDSIYQKLIPHIPESDQSLVDAWYFADTNAKPKQWRLKPRIRGDIYENPKIWSKVERQLQQTLASAALKVNLSASQLLPFTASATHQEISLGALKVPDATEHVMCFFRSIKQIPKEFDVEAFQAALTTTLFEKFGDEAYTAPLRSLLDTLLHLGRNTSVGEIARLINNTQENITRSTVAEDILASIKQILVNRSAHDFIDLLPDSWLPDETAHRTQLRLKKDLQELLPENIHTYQAQWIGSSITTAHLEKLCRDVYESISNIMLEEIAHPHQVQRLEIPVERIKRDPALDEEGQAHLQFAEEQVRFFEGRDTILQNISSYLSSEDQHIFAIAGEGGCGKTTLLARSVQQLLASATRTQVVYRFIGATPASTEITNLLSSLCHEISRRYEIDSSDIPDAIHELIPDLLRRMRQATAQKPLVFFLDSLDQLSTAHGAQTLNWLPNELPEHVHLVVSSREEGFLDTLRDKEAHIEILEGLTQAEGKKLMKSWLDHIQRTLQPEQHAEVMKKFTDSEGNPLYLKLAFEEARLWTSRGIEPVEELAPTLEGIITSNLLKRLEKEQNHGKLLVDRALGYLAASRSGLSEDEMVDILSRDQQIYEWFLSQSHHIPPDLLRLVIAHRPQPVGTSSIQNEQAARHWLTDDRTPPDDVSRLLKYLLSLPRGPKLPTVLWSRLSFDLAPYLNENISDGNPLLIFYHRELKDVVTETILAKDIEDTFRKRLANYFGKQSRFENRRITEQPWQLMKAKQWESLVKLLGDTEMMNIIWERKREDMLTYWSQIESNSSFNVTEAYAPIIDDPSQSTPYTILNLVRLLTELGHPNETISLLEHLIPYYRNKRDLDELQITLAYLASVYQMRGDLPLALQLYREQEQINRQTNNQQGLSDALGNQGVILLQIGEHQKAKLLLQEQDSICREIGNRKGLATSLGNQALLLQNLGQLQDALRTHKEEETILHELGDRSGLSRSYSNQALILKHMGRIYDAQQLLNKSEKLARQIGNKDALQKVIGNKGELHLKQGEFMKAMQYCQEQEQICREIGNRRDLASALGNQGAILMSQGRLKDAMQLFDENENICREIGDRNMLCLTLNNKAGILNQIGRAEEAFSIFKETEKLSRELGQMEGVILCLANQAITAFQHHLADSSTIRSRLEEALDLAKQYGFGSLEGQIKKIHSQIFR